MSGLKGMVLKLPASRRQDLPRGCCAELVHGALQGRPALPLRLREKVVLQAMGHPPPHPSLCVPGLFLVWIWDSSRLDVLLCFQGDDPGPATGSGWSLAHWGEPGLCPL